MMPDAHFSRRFDGTIKGTVAFMRAPPQAIARADVPARPTGRRVSEVRGAGSGRDRSAREAQAFMKLVDHSSNYLTLLETGFDTLASWSRPATALSYGALDEAVSLIERLVPTCQRTYQVA